MSHHKSSNTGFHHLFHTNFDVELLEVGLFQLFRNLGKNMLTLSIAYHLFVNLQYEVWQICVFYFVWQLGFFLWHPVAGWFVERLGLKHSMALMTVTSSIFWLVLPHMLQGDFIGDILKLLPFFLLRGFGGVIFEISYDIFMTHHVNRKARGKVLAYMQIAILLAALLAPIIGAILTVAFSLEAASWLAVALLIIGGGILLLTPDEKVKLPYTPKRLAIDTIKNTPKALYTSQFGWVFQDAVLWILWPIFLAFVVKDLIAMSLIVGLASFLSMIVAYFIGRSIDKQSAKPRDLLREASIRGTVINLCRAVSFLPLIVLTVDFGHKVNWQSLNVPHDNEVFKWLHAKDTYERSHIRWWIIDGIYLISVLFIALCFYLVPNNPQWLFILLFMLAGLSMICTMQVTKLNQD